MTERIFVRVAGFSDGERHALNTLFRLSEEHAPAYLLWMPGAPEAPRLALVDGESYEARMTVATLDPSDDIKLLWVEGTDGGGAPPQAWRSFRRPMDWPAVLRAMDELFAPAAGLDFDLDLGFEATAPGGLDGLSSGHATAAEPPPPVSDGRRALVITDDRETALYLRSKLALAGITEVDEASSGGQGQDLLGQRHYPVVVFDFDLPGQGHWDVFRTLRSAQPPVENIILLASRVSLRDRLKAWFGNAAGFFDKPPHPGKLHRLLSKV